jgi:hypothetical protein
MLNLPGKQNRNMQKFIPQFNHLVNQTGINHGQREEPKKDVQASITNHIPLNFWKDK